MISCLITEINKVDGMNRTLLIRLAAPMQAWGIDSKLMSGIPKQCRPGVEL